MKVFLTDRSHPGGIWGVLHPIAEALRDRGDEPVLVRWRDRAEPFADAPDGVRVVQIDVRGGRTRGTARRWAVVRQLRIFRRAFAELIAAERPAIVHANFILPGAAALLAAGGAAGVRTVLTRHELFGTLSAPLRALDRLTRGRADAVTFVSAAVARSYGSAAEPLSPGGPLSPDGSVPRAAVVYNGVDFAALDAVAAGVRRPPGGSGEIVCAGRLVPVKGQGTLIEALPAVRAAAPGATLTLFGAGPEEGRLRALADRRGVADAVTFAGWAVREEVWRRTAAGVAAAPSTQEGFGLSAAEAAALGGPAVISDIPAFREALRGEPTIRFAPPGDAAAWAAALTDALTGTWSNGSEPGDRRPRTDRADAAGEPRGVRRFSREAMVGGYLRVYAGLVA